MTRPGPLLTRRGVVGLSLALAALVWSACMWWAPATLAALEERSTDLVWRFSADNADERRLLIVDIDERSLAEIGPWPWPRSTQAQLIQRLAQQGVQQQVWDIVFADTTSDDAKLADAISQHQPVLSQVFALEQGGVPMSGQLQGALGWATCPAPFGAASGYLANTTGISQAGRVYVGHITPRVAADGLVRQQPAVVCYDNKAYPALGLVALMKGSSEADLVLERGTSWLDAPWTLRGASPSFSPVPLDRRGDIRIPWRIHPDSFISISAADVLAGRVPAGLMDKAWALIGSSAFGLNDSIATPFNGASSGLQAHAQIITGLIDGRLPFQPRLSMLYLALAALVGLWLLVYLSGKRRFAAYLIPLVAAAWATGLWGVHALLLVQQNMWLGWVEPALLVLAAGLALGVVEHAKSRIDRDRLYGHLSSYLPAPVAASLAVQSPSSAIEASTRQVSVMFADIRNFSAYCEARPPEEAAAVLHAFFSTATEIVSQHAGIVESLKGDAVVAVWHAGPHSGGSDQHASHALKAAVALQQAVLGVLPDPAPEGLEPLSLGIGLETGPALSGSFGLASRRTHLLLGRTVTIAARLADMTADLSHPILLGEGMAAQVTGVELLSMGTFMIDGLKQPRHLYAHPLTSAPRLDTLPHNG